MMELIVNLIDVSEGIKWAINTGAILMIVFGIILFLFKGVQISISLFNASANRDQDAEEYANQWKNLVRLIVAIVPFIMIGSVLLGLFN